MSKAMDTIAKYGNQEKLSVQEAMWLANAAYKVDSRTLSSVYNACVKHEDQYIKKSMLTMYPSGTYPQFADFKMSMVALSKKKDKQFWSVWDALNSFKALSPVAQAEKKIAKQGGNIVTTTDAIREKAKAASAKAAPKAKAAK
jgi:hypothetical protein